MGITTNDIARGMVSALAAAWIAAAPLAVQAQTFSPVISVNGQGITGWEIDQRVAMMSLLGQRGDLRPQAEKDLIDDRLRSFAAARLGISINDEAVDGGMEEFASRANMSREQFLGVLAQGGVDESTFRAFVLAGLQWRAVIQQRFAANVQISDMQIDRMLRPEAQRGDSVRVLLSEIIIPAPPGREAEAMAAANQAASAAGEGAFGAIARQVSATASREQGGRIDWMPLSRLPGPIRSQILALKPGQATRPIEIPNAVAVFMLRGLDEGGAGNDRPVDIDYARLVLGPTGAPETADFAARVAANADACDDLYTLAQGLPADRLERATARVAQIPQDIAVTLASLDPGETRQIQRGANAELVMLCARTLAMDTPEAPATEEGAEGAAPADPADAMRAGAENRARAAQVEARSEGYLADLRAEAVITRP